MTQGRIRGRFGAPLVALLIVTIVAVMGIVGTASAKPAARQKWVLGVSNTLVGNGWREEMICAVKAQALASGKVSKVIVANRNGGPAEQIADIRNLISAGANAIIINPSSATALNAVVAQAAARGVKIVSVDQRITAPQAYNVTNDQVAYGRLGAEWLFKKLGGKGNVVEMRGIAGVPADTDRHTGFQQALKKYPGIKVVKQTFTGLVVRAGRQADARHPQLRRAGRRRLDVRDRLHGRQRVQDGRQAVRAGRGRGQQRSSSSS